MAPKSPTQARPMSTLQIASLAASFVVALGSGTNYVFSVYSPQLGARLNISHTQLNILGLAGNAGVYSGGLLWGTIADPQGLRILLSRSFIFILAGYSGIKYFYDSGTPEAEALSNFGFGFLVFCSFLTGCGGGGGFASSVNAVAKSLPDQERGPATGLIASAFVLSAFFFSTICNIFFVREISAFLLFLSLGTSISMIMGFFLVSPTKLPDEGACQWDNYRLGNNSRSHLLDPILTEGENAGHHTYTLSNGAVYTTVDFSEHSENHTGQESGPNADANSSLLRNLQNRGVWWSGDFWLLFSILSLLGGIGLTYMNNVGSMLRFLYAYKNWTYNEVEAFKWQTAQVSTISFMNFSGRLLIGSISDMVKNRYDMPRSYLITLVASLLLLSQVVAANVSNFSHLWMASSLLGLAHGSAVSLFPTVCLEWFGMSTFSESWGYIGASPMIAGSIISFIFGQNIDMHSKPRVFAVPLIAPALPNCLQGLNCYVQGTHLTIGAGALAVLLSIWAGYKDRKRNI